MTRDELLDKLAMELVEWPEVAINQFKNPAHEHGVFSALMSDEVGGSRVVFETEELILTKAQYLQRRAELINKPSWDDAPEWAQWLSQDADGEWNWFDEEPYMDLQEWCISYQEMVGKARHGALVAGHDWRQTLESRPLSSHIKNADSFVSHRMELKGGSPCMDCGTADSVHAWDCPSHERDQGEQRIDNIGRNGGDGDHYEGITGVKHRVSEFETRHDCNRCGGSYYTPPHDECPCSVSGAGASKYHREIKPGVFVDVYDVLQAWGVANPALQHLIKKALQPGDRGHKTLSQDMDDIVASAERARELEK